MSIVPIPLPEPRNHLPAHIREALDLEIAEMMAKGHTRRDVCNKYQVGFRTVTRSIARQKKKNMIKAITDAGGVYVEPEVSNTVYRVSVLTNVVYIWKILEKSSELVSCHRIATPDKFDAVIGILTDNGISKESKIEAFEYLAR